MTLDQLSFASLLAEADRRAQDVRDQHLTRVQQFFDALPETHKRTLAALMTAHVYDTCLGLSAAACDWYQAHLKEVQK